MSTSLPRSALELAALVAALFCAANLACSRDDRTGARPASDSPPEIAEVQPTSSAGALPPPAASAASSVAAPREAAPARQVALYVRVPGALDPLVGREKYGDPLDAALGRAGLGRVVHSRRELDEHGRVRAFGLELEVDDRARALALVRGELARLGAPRATVIEELDERGGPALVHEVAR